MFSSFRVSLFSFLKIIFYIQLDFFTYLQIDFFLHTIKVFSNIQFESFIFLHKKWKFKWPKHLHSKAFIIHELRAPRHLEHRTKTHNPYTYILCQCSYTGTAGGCILDYLCYVVYGGRPPVWWWCGAGGIFASLYSGAGRVTHSHTRTGQLHICIYIKKKKIYAYISIRRSPPPQLVILPKSFIQD